MTEPNLAPAWSVELVWVVLGIALVVYVLTGGADFGAGLWHWLASGPRAEQQRRTIERSIAPIWEANHVWLIFIVVVVFTIFPDAFATIGVALHIPIALALVGIVLRGSAFVFRAYGLESNAVRKRWGHVFAGASSVTPVFLGMVLGGMSSGRIHVAEGAVTTGFFAGWTSPFAVCLGLFTLALFALLAAVYSCVAAAPELQGDFARRVLVSEAVAGALALAVLWRARSDAPILWQRLTASAYFWPAQLLTAGLALAVVVAISRARFAYARVGAAAQVVFVVVLWGLAMDGDLVLNAHGILSSGARAETVEGVLPALAVGFSLCVPALLFLFRLFRSRAPR